MHTHNGEAVNGVLYVVGTLTALLLPSLLHCFLAISRYFRSVNALTIIWLSHWFMLSLSEIINVNVIYRTLIVVLFDFNLLLSMFNLSKGLTWSLLQSVIQMNGFRSLGDEEEVEFECKVSDKGLEATRVTGPSSGDCQGSHRRPVTKKRFRKIRLVF